MKKRVKQTLTKITTTEDAIECKECYSKCHHVIFSFEPEQRLQMLFVSVRSKGRKCKVGFERSHTHN